MRVMVAYDGSPGADQAVSLLCSSAPPPGASVRLALVVPGVVEIRHTWGHLALEEASGLESGIAVTAESLLKPVAERLSEHGCLVDTVVLKGRASHALAEEAARMGAELVVVGSRRLGALEATLLGSVSAELVDMAPCPVLVARSDRLRRVVLATDGSPEAMDAESWMARSPLLAGLPVTVVSVAELLVPWSAGTQPTNYQFAVEAYAEQEDLARRSHQEIAAAAAQRLASRHVDAASMVAVGDPAAEIVAAAERLEAGLIVLGSRGRTGLQRLVLGSVARRVLQRSSSSVLIVRRGAVDAGGQADQRGP